MLYNRGESYIGKKRDECEIRQVMWRRDRGESYIGKKREECEIRQVMWWREIEKNKCMYINCSKNWVRRIVLHQVNIVLTSYQEAVNFLWTLKAVLSLKLAIRSLYNCMSYNNFQWIINLSQMILAVCKLKSPFAWTCMISDFSNKFSP